MCLAITYKICICFVQIDKFICFCSQAQTRHVLAISSIVATHSIEHIICLCCYLYALISCRLAAVAYQYAVKVNNEIYIKGKSILPPGILNKIWNRCIHVGAWHRKALLFLLMHINSYVWLFASNHMAYIFHVYLYMSAYVYVSSAAYTHTSRLAYVLVRSFDVGCVIVLSPS